MHLSNNFRNPGRSHYPERESRSIHQQLAECPRRGVALRNIRADDRGRILDIFVALEGVAYFGIQVREGRYCRAVRHLMPHKNREGLQQTDPFEAISRCVEGVCTLVQNALETQLAVVKVLVFTGMDPDPSINSLAESLNVGVIWKPESIVENLVSLAGDVQAGIHLPPTSEEITDVAQVLLTRIHDQDSPTGFATMVLP